MRVVAGSARGCRLIAPRGQSVRPTSDRVREATFNALGSLALVDEATVVDLFAGSGALGIEALSRGAAHATFVDRDPGSLDCVRSNLERTHLQHLASVVRSEAQHWAASAPPVDLAFCDPPYAFDRWEELLDTLDAAAVVIESDRPIDAGERWTVVREKRYGDTVLAIALRPPAAGRDRDGADQANGETT